MKRKAQATDIIFFFVLLVGIFLASIVVLRLVNTILNPFQAQIGNMSAPAGVVVGAVHEKFTNWWDVFIVLLMLVNIILLFVSAFLIDIHPAFVIVYIIAVFFMFIMGNYALSALDSVWGGMATAEELSQTPMQQFIMNHFGIIMLGIVILSGVIMYTKFKMFGGQGGGGMS